MRTRSPLAFDGLCAFLTNLCVCARARVCTCVRARATNSTNAERGRERANERAKEGGRGERQTDAVRAQIHGVKDTSHPSGSPLMARDRSGIIMVVADSQLSPRHSCSTDAEELWWVAPPFARTRASNVGEGGQ